MTTEPDHHIAFPSHWTTAETDCDVVTLNRQLPPTYIPSRDQPARRVFVPGPV